MGPTVSVASAICGEIRCCGTTEAESLSSATAVAGGWTCRPYISAVLVRAYSTLKFSLVQMMIFKACCFCMTKYAWSYACPAMREVNLETLECGAYLSACLLVSHRGLWLVSCENVRLTPQFQKSFSKGTIADGLQQHRRWYSFLAFSAAQK